jgi:hypothetical protein
MSLLLFTNSPEAQISETIARKILGFVAHAALQALCGYAETDTWLPDSLLRTARNVIRIMFSQIDKVHY